MPFKVSETQGVPPGQYKGQLIRVEDAGVGQYGPQRKWFFLVDVNGEGQEHMEWTSTNVSPKSKAYKYLKGLLGRDLQAGEEIDDPVGKTAILNFIAKPNGYSSLDSIVPIVEPVQAEAGIPR
jgi:hypothetical protein